ncbi:MAG: molybdopterin-dependent oxidoreductase, partial [Anaerolineae bacterium]
AIVDLGLARGKITQLSEMVKHDPANVSQTTGIPEGTIREVGRLIATSEKPAFVYGKGITRQDSSQALEALIDLARLVGASTDSRSTIIGTKGQANSTAAYMYGLDKTFEINGHQAVYLALGDDKVGQRLLQRLEKAPFIAVQASYVSSVTEMADVVLPAEMWAEQGGHYLNLEGRLQQAHSSLTPSCEVWSNVKILETIAANMGFKLNADWKKALRGRVPTTGY